MSKHKISILYSWFVRTSTKILPDAPIVMKTRGYLYSLMMQSCGKNFQVCSSTYINSLSSLAVGNNVYLAHNTVILGKSITLCDDVMVGPNTVIVSGNHTFSGNSFRFGKSKIKPILIEKGAWVAANCTILGGSIFPPRSILGAGSVFNKEAVEGECLYAGSPAKKIKKLDL